MRATKVLTLILLLFLPAIAGCGPGKVAEDPIGFSTVLQQIGDINQVRCPEIAPADVAKIQEAPVPRPWTSDSGVKLGQLQKQVDALELQVREKNAAGGRVVAEHARCRGVEPPARPKPATS